MLYILGLVLWFWFRFLLEFDVDVALDVDALVNIGQNRRFCRLDHRFDKRVGVAFEDERERDFVAFDADVVFHHLVFHKALAVSRVFHLVERVDYKFRI